MLQGIVTPLVTLVPGAHARWERQAGVEELVTLAQAADRLGYHHLTCSEHVAVPEGVAATRGGCYWDPLATLSYLAAATSTIRLATHVLVLGYHHPMALAKRYGTLDRLSGGRLVLGVGVGSLGEEFELLGAPFADRGERADEALRALRATLSRPKPSFAGDHYRYEGFVVDPCALQPRVPIWVGGRTARSLRRAVELADGWAPFGLSLSQMSGMLTEAGPPAGFEVVLSPERALDPIGDPDGSRRRMEELEAAGATVANLRLFSRSLSHYCDQLEAMAQISG